MFTDYNFTWNFYTIAKTPLTTWYIKIIDKKKFAKALLDENVKHLYNILSFLV